MPELGRLLLVLGVLLIVTGLALIFFPSLRPGRLPGDLVFRKGNWTFYFPLTSGLILSVVVTLVLWLILSLKK